MLIRGELMRARRSINVCIYRSAGGVIVLEAVGTERIEMNYS